MATLTRIKTGEVVGSTRLTTGADTMNDDKAATKKAAPSSSPAREEWASDSGNVKLTRIAQKPAVSTPIAAPAQIKTEEEKPGFFDRVWNTIKGGTKAAASQTSEAMANLYAGGQKQRNAQMLDDLKDVEWAVAMAMRDYDYSVKDYGENSGDATAAKNILDSNLTKLAAYATVLGDGVYDLALNEARDAANRLGNSEDPTDIYRSLAQFDLSGTTGVQQKAVAATYGMNDELTNAAVQDIEAAKQGLGKVGSAVVDFSAGMIPIAAQVAADAVAPGTGSIGRTLTVGGAAGQRYRATAGEDFTPENAAAVTLAAGGGGVAAGKLLSQGIGSLGIKMLKNIGQTTTSGVVTNGANGLMNNVLANIGLGGARAVGYAAGETGVNEITKAVTEDNYTPDWGQIGSSLATSFAFGALTTAVGTIKTTQANKTWMRQYSDALKQRYSIFEHYLQYGTPEQRAAAAAEYQTMASQFLNGLDNLHAVGAQGEINEIRSFVWNTMMQMDDVITAGNVYNAGTPVSGTPMIGNGAASAQLAPVVDTAQAGGEIGLAAAGNNVPAPAAEPTAPAPVTQAPSTPAPAPAAPIQAEPIAQQLMAAGADEASAQELAPILSEILGGQEISGNEAAKIAKSEAAVSILEKTTGTQIDTDAPISAVKTAIKGLASPTESASDVRTGNLPMAAQNAPSAVSAPSGTRDGKTAIAEFAGAFGSEGKTALTQNYDGNINPRDYAEAMTRFYNAGAASAKGQSINTEAMMRANTALSQQQKLAAYRAGIRDTEAAAAKSQATAPAAQQSNEAIWNANNAQLMTADGRSPASYRYETVAVLTDGTALHVFYDSKAKAEAATRNAVGLRGEGTQIVVDLRQPGALEKALKDVTYASGQQRAESEIRVAGSREAAEEARNTAAKLERQRVAAMNGEEVNTDGENGIVRQGRERNVPQRAGRETDGVPEAAEATGGKRRSAADPGRDERALQAGVRTKRVKARSLFGAAADTEIETTTEAPTKAMQRAKALAEKNGVELTSFKGEVPTDLYDQDGRPIVVRGYAIVGTKKIGAQYDNDLVAQDDIERHEIMELKLGAGEVDADEVIELAKSYGDEAKINAMIDFYDRFYPSENQEHAKSEMVCDGADHINQARHLGSAYSRIADAFDDALDALNRAANELTGGAFDLEGEAAGQVPVKESGGSAESTMRFSIKYDLDNTPYVVVENDILSGVPETEWVKVVKDNLRRKFPDGITVGENTVVINQSSRREMTFSNYMRRLFKTEPQMYADKLRATDNADEILKAARNWVNEALMHPRADAIIDFARGEVQLRIGSNDYTAQVIVGNRGENGLVLYDIINLTPSTIQERTKKTGADRFITKAQSKPGDSQSAPAADSVTDIPEKSNSKFSAKVTAADTDSAGASLSEGQRSYFADSKVRDAQGRLKVMYRGGNGDYTVFDRRKSKPSNLYGRGFYFTDSQSHAAQYGEAKPYYLNITNPLTPDQHVITKQQMRSFLEAVAADEDYGLENYGYGATVDSVLQSIYGKGDFEMLQDVNATAVGDLVTAVELFNEVNGTGYDGIIVPTETVAFQSEQIKNTDNLNPTKDKDVRFSRKVDLEESEDLVAVHNLTEKNLADALDLGGLPMPSIAVVKAKSGHSKYGPISLVFGKDTIDPNVSAANRVYGGDAYTPTAPSVGYKVDYDVMKSIRDKLHGLLDDETYNTMQLRIDTENLTDKLQRSSGDFKDAYGRESGMKLAFLKDTGRKITVPKKDKAYRAYVPILREIIKKFDVLALQEMGYEESKTYEPQIRKMLYDYELANGSQKTAPNGKTFAQMTADHLYGDTMSYGEYTAIIDSAADIKRHGVMRVIDTKKLDSRIDAYFKTKKMQAEYEAWLDDLSKGIIAKKGIRNNADWFTRNGNRRSFEALYDDYTLSNIVKAMKAGQEERGGQTMGVSAGLLQSVATPSYGSIAEIKADSGRLARYDDEAYEAMKKEIDDELMGLVDKIYNTTKHWSDNSFIEYDSIAEAMINAARRGGTADAIVRSFKRDGYDISKDIAQQLQGLYKRSADLPTEYFEAKPRRGVGFDEVLAVVAPKNINAGLKQRLTDDGIAVITYKTGDDADRTKKINSIDGARFSRKITTFEDLRTENRELKDKLAEYQDTARELAKATKQATYWKGQTQLTKEPSVRQDDVDKLAKKIVKGYDSTVDAKDVAADIKALGDYIVRGGDDEGELTWTDVKDRAVSIARDIVENAETIIDDGELDTFNAIKSYFRDAKINYTDNGDIPDYGDFRKRNFGRLHLVKNGGIGIDVLWLELNGMFGEAYFPSDIANPSDMILHVADLLQNMEPIYGNPFSYDMAEATEYCANEIIDELLSESIRQMPPTFADKQAAKLDAQKAKDAQRLAKLREQKDAQIKEIRRRGQERAKEALKRVRADRDQKIAELKEHYREKEAKSSEKRKATELRRKIAKHAKEMTGELLRPSDKHHIPEALRGSVAKLLEAINLESGYDVEYGTDALYHRVPRGSSQYSEATARTKAFAEVRKALSDAADGMVIDPDLFGDGMNTGLFDDVAALADKPIANMNTAELTTVWQTIRGVEAAIRSVNKTFSAGRFATISEAAEALRRDNAGKTEKSEYRGIIGGAQKLTTLDMLTPEAFLHRLGDSGDAIFRMLRDAQDQHIRIMKEAADFTKQAIGDMNVRDLEKELHTVTLGGEEVKLSTAQIMEIYALWRRGEQAQQHIIVGGIMPEELKGKRLKKISRSGPVRGITLPEIIDLTAKLTPEQMRLAETLQDFVSGPLSKYGNKASMEVYNYEKFTEPRYWPIRSNKQEVNKTVEKDTQTASVANRGFTKAVKPNANNSVMIGSIFDTFAQHVSDMATYAAYLGAMEDANRIRNFVFRDSDGNRTGTIDETIKRVHGSRGSNYLERLLSDLSNGVKGTGNGYGKLMGSYKASAIGANIRVFLQQPTAIIRAAEMIDPKYLAVGMKPQGGWKKAKQYVPIAQWKDWGYFDIGTGRQMKDVLFDTDNALQKVNNALIAPAGWMDSIAWGQLWNAVEAETKAEHKELSPGSGAYYDHVAKRFTEIIDKTQVVDGILQRSGIMRNPDSLSKMATSFMSEPTKQYNMFLSSAYDATHGSQEQRKAGKKRLARTIVALIASFAANAAAQSLVDAMRDDDKDKKYWERFWTAYFGIDGTEETNADYVSHAIGGNFESAFIIPSYIPYAKDALSLLQGYDVGRMDMESLSKVFDATKDAFKALNGSSKRSVANAMTTLLAEASRLLGVPLSNIKRDVIGITGTVAVETDNYLMQYALDKALYNMDNSSARSIFLDTLYKAYVNVKGQYEALYAKMIKDGIPADKIKSGMEERMKKAAGVDKVSELESRYLAPDQQDSYDKGVSALQRSDLWRGATDDAQDAALDLLYGLVSGSNAAAAKIAREKIEGGADVGLDQTEYLLYKLALSMADEPTESGKLGSYTNDEVEEAIRMLPGLTDKERDYLWIAQGKNENKIPKW